MSSSVHIGPPAAANCHPSISGSFQMCLSHSLKQILASCHSVPFLVPVLAPYLSLLSPPDMSVYSHSEALRLLRAIASSRPSPHLTHYSVFLHDAIMSCPSKRTPIQTFLGDSSLATLRTPSQSSPAHLSSAQLRALTVGSSPHQLPFWAGSLLQ